METVLNQGHYTNEQFATAIDGLNWHGKLTAINCGVQAGLDQLDTTDNVNDVLIGKLFSAIHLSEFIISFYRWCGQISSSHHADYC